MEESGKLYEICIQKGREHRAVLTPDRVNSPTEFFYNSYQDAKYQLREIVLASFQNKKDEEEQLTTKERIELLHKYPNNVIAFCADRGRGKTTAMLSFSNALEMLGASEKGDPLKFWDNILDKERILAVRFEVMASIDPASMENSESVLEQIISQLFENFCRKVKSKSRYESGGKNSDRDALSCMFQKCAQAIDALYKDPKTRDTLIEDELDKISEIGQSAKLLLLLHELIDKYLDFMRDKESKCCLVVQIDDADMDIGRSYQILEDVRKYLGLPRVVVLMATNVQQLETTVEQHFLKEYERGLKYDDSMITVERCHDIAVLYLEKAIPHPRRIYLPDIGETIRQHLSQFRVNYQDAENLLPEKTYQEQLLNLLHRKTGLVFTFEPDYLHNLLPAHMRELCQFLSFFDSMKDVSDGYEVAIDIFQKQSFSEGKSIPQFLDQWEKNLSRLEFYVVDLWSAVNLREGSRNLFRGFAAQPETIRNLYLLRNITDYYVRERMASENTKPVFAGSEADCRKEFEEACKMRGVDLSSYLKETVQGEMNVSYADVMGVLAALTDLPGANRQYKFAYAIRVFYSIRLHKALIQEIRMIGNREESINFHPLTDLLRDTLLKNGPINDTAQTPFGCWILEMPVQWFPDYLLAGETDEPGKTASPFLRWKYKKDHTVRMLSTVDAHKATYIWRPVNVERGQKEPDIIVFNPLYPLLDVLDWFVRLKKVDQIKDDIRYLSQIYIALLICLNWDVQRVLFKKIKNQDDDTVGSMLSELYTRHIADCIKTLPEMPSWFIVEQERIRFCFDTLWEKEKQEFFDILTKRVRPVPEFKTYIRQADDGIRDFEAHLANIQKLYAKAGTNRLKTLWKRDSEPTWRSILEKMEEDVQKVFFGVDVVIECIKKELPKGDTLYKILEEYLKKKKISAKEFPFTPNAILEALVHYRELLEQLMKQGPDAANGKLSPKETVARSQKAQDELPSNAESIVQKKDDGTTIDVPSLISANDSEAAVKTLQSLIQLGQQILNVLTAAQQEKVIESEKNEESI